MPKKKKAAKLKLKKKAAPPKPVPMLTCPITGAQVPADQAGKFMH